MNKKPFVLRTIIVLVVILVFSLSMYPLTQRDFYETFQKMLKDPQDQVAAELIEDARKAQAQDASIYASTALLDAANAKGVELGKLINTTKDVQHNRDVISLIRKEASSSIRLGLDLNGGVEFTLELVESPDFLNQFNSTEEDREELEKRKEAEFARYRDIAIETLRKRLESQNIYEAEIAPTGSRYISLRVPVVSKEEMVKIMELIKMSARLRFQLVHPNNSELVAAYQADPENFKIPPDYELMKSVVVRQGREPYTELLFVKRRFEMDGKHITRAEPVSDRYGQIKISLAFDSAGAKRFGEVTRANVGQRLAIILDGKLYSAPNINEAIENGSAEISGDFSREEAKNIADALSSGAMPFQINVTAVFNTDPSLGQDNVTNGIWAGIVALGIVMLFVGIYYQRAGLVAVIALLVNVVLLLGMMAAFSATLTLPGIAGIVLTIGMAVDTNVLIFERMREEVSAGKSITTALDLGYAKAFSAVMDANVTTLITALVLAWFGTGAVKGFAVTLAFGILTSLFTGVFLTRLVFDIMVRLGWLNSLHMFHFLSNPHFDFLKYRKVALGGSLLLVIASLVLFAVKGKDMFGVDFTGGMTISFDYQERVPQQELEKALAQINFGDARIAYKENASFADNRKLELMIRDNAKVSAALHKTSPKELIEAHLNQCFPNAKFSGGQESSVGGLVGEEFTKSAVKAVVLAFVGIIIYVTLRYQISYALAGIIALIHDVIIALGIFVVFDREVTLTVIAAMLTIIGYSLNDTIVVFDRVRENLHNGAPGSYGDVVNLSLNQTLSRTILTSLSTFLVLVVLFFWGGIAINDFVLVMSLGIIIGTYSSIFVASSLVVMWHKQKRHKEVGSPEMPEIMPEKEQKVLN